MLLKRVITSRFLRPSLRALSCDVSLTEYGISDSGRGLLHVETRNMCRCEACYGKHSHQKLLLDIRDGVKVTEVGKISEHYVSLKWDDGHEGQIARTRRGAHGPQPIPDLLEKYFDLTMRRNEKQVFWDVQNEENSKAFSYDEVVRSDNNTREFLAHFMKYGIGIMSGVPAHKTTMDIINLDLECGPMRETVFEMPDIVRFRADPTNVAYRSDYLPGHTDLPYYIQMPQIFLFHCLENNTQNGASFWIDTFSAMNKVRHERPDYFEILSRVPTFMRHTPPGTGRYLASPGKILHLLNGNIMRVRDHPPCADEYEFVRQVDLETRAAWWDAYLFYRTIIEDESRWLYRKMGAGDIAFIDNHRVLHGRDSFTASKPGDERIMAISYADWGHFQQRLLYPREELFLELEKH